MSSVDLNILNRRANILFKTVNIIYWLTVSALIIMTAFIGWVAFLPAESFQAEKGVSHWLMSVTISNNGASIDTSIPFSLLQPINPESLNMFEAKPAFLTFFVFKFLLFFIILIYGIMQLKQILNSIKKLDSPFTVYNAIKLRNIALVIIGYSLMGNVIVNLAMNIFVTQVLFVNFSNISFGNLIFGLLLLFVAQIFRYGTFLQHEFDTTL